MSYFLTTRSDALSRPEFQYVPILESLVNLFKLDYVKEQFLNPENVCNDCTLKDYYHGALFKQNCFFSPHENTIDLILYQDAFEIANPLGPAKTCHKLLAVYFMLGNLHSFNRSKLNPIQLVLLSKEKDVTAQAQTEFFKPLIHDLKILEAEGIDVGLGNKIRGRIICITGDNLGQHWVGGFTTSFNTSASAYFCRFCNIQGKDFLEKPSMCGKLRTTASYDECINKLKQPCQLNHICGIKHCSAFNALASFHVCMPALAPCIAHDLFEGIVSYDMMIFINHFVHSGWFTEKYINFRIKSFRYDSTTSKSKALPIKIASKKLSGNASQNWCFLRYFPLFIIHKIKNDSDPVWKLLLLLCRIVEMICSPSTTYDQISYLVCLIEEYLSMRLTLFPSQNLRPKHHYLIHYPWLMYNFGPLIHIWTLRFEGKHTYFKRCIRNTHNFVNVTATLANHHQMFQGYLLSTGLFDPVLKWSENSNCYSSDIVNVLAAQPIVLSKTYVCKSATYKGTCYLPGQYVVLGKNELDLNVGKIILCAVYEKKLYFVIRKMIACFQFRLGVYITKHAEKQFISIPVDDLYDYYPLHAYKCLQETECLVLKHFV